MLHWFLGGVPISAIGYGGVKVRTNMALMDNLTVCFKWPNGINVNFEANQITPRGFYSKVGEEFTGTKGFITTSRQEMVHVKSPEDTETIPAERDITMDGIELFLEHIQSGKVWNMAEEAAMSTMIALLGPDRDL